jgi:hypothetical protein
VLIHPTKQIQINNNVNGHGHLHKRSDTPGSVDRSRPAERLASSAGMPVG